MPSFQVNASWAAMTEVVPNLYICGVTALKPSILTAMEIDLIVNCTKEVPNLLNLPPTVERLKLWLDDQDDTDLDPYLDMAVDHIRMTMEADGRVLVHCVAGVSRSAAVCLAYLVKYENMSLREAYEHLASRRQRVRPNLGFWRQLIEYEAEMRGETSVRIVKRGDGEGGCQILPDVYEDARLKGCVGKKCEPVTACAPAPQKDVSPAKRLREERKRQRTMSDGDCAKRFVPKLETVPECEP